uniref:NADH dehydrogenase subunit 6 n=1 Tax=Phallusia fumigata TaxID=395376 RepID=A7WL88_9ASCI|nr:NADH dehydrogenase subunit 6 [Phallusia fumigata]CAL24356.1 NADH dehydrogenase subunit 6 [Phallusia fumigata]
MLFFSELSVLGWLGVMVSLYMVLGGSVVLMVALVVFFALGFMWSLLVVDLFLWGVMMGLLYLGGMMVLFSYSSMLMGGVDEGVGGGKAPLSGGELLYGAFVGAVCGCGLVGGLGTWGGWGCGGVGQLWLYGSGYFLAAVVILVVVLLVCLHLCVEGWVC